jgi:DNA-binding transcriptional ArsR family regulator
MCAILFYASIHSSTKFIPENVVNSIIHRNIAMKRLKNMGVSKTELFTEKQNQLASIAKTLGHPARIAILEHLISINACICNDLVLELGLAQATISQHLKELKNAGIIKGSVEGTSICYCINPEAWNKYRGLFDTFFVHLPTLNNAACGTDCCN